MGALTRPAAATSAWIAGICGLAVAGSVAALVALEHSASAPAVAATARVEVAASFESPVVQFGDRILARVVVAFDTRRVQPQTLRLTDDLAPLTQLGAAGTSRLTHGSLELETVVIPVSCLTAPCVARSGVVQVVLPLIHASVLARDGRIARASAAWPTLSVRGRVTAADLAARTPPFAVDATPPAPTYRIAPGTLGTLLTLLAVLCAVGAIAFAGWEAHIRIGRRRRQPTALERALRLTREAERHSVSDRRRALASLGRALERDQRSGAARELAWSEAVPEPHELETLVTEIEEGSGR